MKLFSHCSCFSELEDGTFSLKDKNNIFLTAPNKLLLLSHTHTYHHPLIFNPLAHMPILGPSNSAANKNMMAKIWTNGVQLCD